MSYEFDFVTKIITAFSLYPCFAFVSDAFNTIYIIYMSIQQDDARQLRLLKEMLIKTLQKKLSSGMFGQTYHITKLSYNISGYRMTCDCDLICSRTYNFLVFDMNS